MSTQVRSEAARADSRLLNPELLKQPKQHSEQPQTQARREERESGSTPDKYYTYHAGKARGCRGSRRLDTGGCARAAATAIRDGRCRGDFMWRLHGGVEERSQLHSPCMWRCDPSSLSHPSYPHMPWEQVRTTVCIHASLGRTPTDRRRILVLPSHWTRQALFDNKGINCPYGVGRCRGLNGTRKITPADLDALVRYGHENAEAIYESSSEQRCNPMVSMLQQADVDKLLRWLKPSTPRAPEVDLPPYIEMTTKKCPSCGKRASVFF